MFPSGPVKGDVQDVMDYDRGDTQGKINASANAQPFPG